MTKIAIIGCYRSGSSAIAGALEAMGIHMGAPFHCDHFEPADLAAQLRDWWSEPNLIENALREERVAGLRAWLAAHTERTRGRRHGPAIGVKHPLLTLSAGDLLEAWGEDVRFVWARRPLADSIASLHKRFAWPNAHLVQSYLWHAAADLCERRLHAAIDFDDLRTRPARVLERIVGFAGLTINITPGVEFLTRNHVSK